MSLFLHCSVLFELRGLPIKEKEKIKFAVTENGGSIAFVANKQCSLVVTSAVSSLSPSRLRNIVKYQIPVVGVDYVHRCLEANQRLPVEDFKLNISSSANALDVVKKDKWSSSPQSQAVHVQPVNASAESTRGRGSVIKQRHRIDHDTAQDQAKFPENFQVAKYSVFQKPNSQCWTLLELQSAKSERGRQYRVAKYWRDDIQSRSAAVRDEMVSVSTSEAAVSMFQDLTDSLNAEGLRLQQNAPPQVTEMGSAPLQQLLLEEKLNMGALSPEVGVFVELLWQEALGCIHLILNTPVHKISLNDVTRAEGLLFQIQRKITERKLDEMISLWSEFCSLLPPRSIVSPNKSTVSKQLDLCQLIRDILNVSEMTLGSAVPSSVGKYRALRCSIDVVPQESSEFKTVTSLLQNSKVQAHQILRVNRAPELQNFRNELGNIKPLLHSSSPHNFVGILSRGLLMPHVAVDQHGVQRTDAGNLGSGIYFTDDIKTTLKYSQCSSTDGSRLMLICDVALGQCKDVFKKDLTLTQAPEGYHSVHGAQGKPGLLSEFMDDEYVVYNIDQVKLKYVVRLSMEGDELKNFTPEIVEPEESTLPSLDQVGAVEDGISDIKNPLESVTAGLLNSSGQQIPLKAVHVKCKLMDLLAQVIIFQNYTNESPVPIEAKYVFPLDDSAAVSGFEAFINGKHVVGQVKEKETARREYKQAIEKGHGAYLMDQDAPDVFTISVGNLPPGATVLIKVTFVSELIVKDGSIVFSLPSSVAPWQESAALNQTTQVTVEKVCVTDEGASTRQFNLDMSIEMPHEITEVKCSTHKVKMKKTDCKAVVSVLPGEIMGEEGFQLLITLTEVHVPRMWVEKHPSKDSQACMLVFYPKFEAPSCVTSDEVVLLLDASQSMKGESLNTARMLALQVLKTLNHNVHLNVIFFATDYKGFSLSARPIGESRQDAKNFIKHFSSTGGSTELWRPLRALSLLPPSNGTRNLLLLSDGHIQNPELTLQLIRENSTHTRLFSCGLSPTANRHMLRALAQAGGGAYEFFDSKSKHTWSEKVGSQIKRMLVPGAKSVSVKWQQFNPAAPPPVQAPKELHALFNDCHTLVFGFVPHCTQATLLGNLSGEEIKTMVSTSELQKTKGTFLHKLTARAIIRDFEDGSLDSNAVLHEEKKAELKSFVIELSKEFSILSQFTSFVAIEERDSEEDTGFTDIHKIIAAEDVDFLPYMSWAEEEEIHWSNEEDEEEYEEYEQVCDVISSSSQSSYEGDLDGVMCRMESIEPQMAEDYDTAILEPLEQIKSFCVSKSVLDETAESIEPQMAEDDDTAILETSDRVMSLRESELVLDESAESIEAEMAENYDTIFPEPSYRSRRFYESPPVRDEESSPMAARRALRRRKTISAPAPPPVLLRRSIEKEVWRPCSLMEEIAREDTSLALDQQQPPPPPPPPPPPSFGAPGTLHVAPGSFAFNVNQVCMSSEPSPLLSFPGPSSALFGSGGPMTGGAGSMQPHFRRTMAYGQQPPPPPLPVPLQEHSITALPPPIQQSAWRRERQNVLIETDGLSTSPERSSTGFAFGRQLLPQPQGLSRAQSAPAQEFRPTRAPRSRAYRKALVVEPLSFGSVEEMQTTETLIPHSENTVTLTSYKSCALENPKMMYTESSLMEKTDFSSNQQDQHVAFFPQPNEYLKTHSYASESSPSASKWQIIFSLQHLEGYWEITPQLGQLLNCNISHFANDFLKRKGIASLGLKAQADILKLLATLLVLQLMRLEKIKEGEMLRTLFCLEDSMCRPDHWEAVNRAVKWVVWADREYPCIYSRLEFGLSWDLSTKQLLGAEAIHHCSPLKGFNLNPTPYPGPLMQC